MERIESPNRAGWVITRARLCAIPITNHGFTRVMKRVGNILRYAINPIHSSAAGARLTTCSGKQLISSETCM